MNDVPYTILGKLTDALPNKVMSRLKVNVQKINNVISLLKSQQDWFSRLERNFSNALPQEIGYPKSAIDYGDDESFDEPLFGQGYYYLYTDKYTQTQYVDLLEGGLRIIHVTSGILYEYVDGRADSRFGGTIDKRTLLDALTTKEIVILEVTS